MLYGVLLSAPQAEAKFRNANYPAVNERTITNEVTEKYTPPYKWPTKDEFLVMPLILLYVIDVIALLWLKINWTEINIS